MTDPIAEKAEALWAKRPELRPTELEHTDNGFGWYLEGYPISHFSARMLIEATCWRALPGYLWDKTDNGNIRIYEDSIDGAEWIGVSEPSITEALIAACMEANQ